MLHLNCNWADLAKRTFITCDSIGSRLVPVLISITLTGVELRSSIANTVSAGNDVVGGLTGKGNRLRASAFACSGPGLYLME